MLALRPLPTSLRVCARPLTAVSSLPCRRRSGRSLRPSSAQGQTARRTAAQRRPSRARRPPGAIPRCLMSGTGHSRALARLCPHMPGTPEFQASLFIASEHHCPSQAQGSPGPAEKLNRSHDSVIPNQKKPLQQSPLQVPPLPPPSPLSRTSYPAFPPALRVEP